YVTTYFILLALTLFMNCAKLVHLILITLISDLSTLVIVLINFNEISISGLILNIFFVPLFSFIIFPSVIVYNILLFFHVPPAIHMLYHFLYTLMKDSIYYLAGAFKHRFPVKNLPDVSIIIMMFLTYRLSVHVLAFKIKKIISCILVFLLVLFLSQQHLNRDFTLTMVDVGQGDAYEIQDHNTKNKELINS